VDDLEKVMDPKLYVGRAPEQVVEFNEAEIEPIIARYESLLDYSVDLKV